MTNEPINADECMVAPAWWREQDFDLDPDVGVPTRGRAQLVHLPGPFRCGVCGSAPMTVRSDFGFMDFTYCDDDDDEPEWVGLCWECAKPIVYGECEE